MSKSDVSMYGGADYGFSPYKDEFLGLTTRQSFSSIALATDVRTANQIKATSDKINAGAKVIEVGMLSPEVAESIPRQHLDEINRLRKLAGVELTLHGPLVEATGVTREGWTEEDRKQAERQISLAVERGHQLDPEGNVVVTFHSSSLPETMTKVFNPETKKEELKSFLAVDERTGQIQPVKIQPSYLEPKKNLSAQETMDETLKDQNEKIWANSLHHIDFYADQGARQIKSALKSMDEEGFAPEEKAFLKDNTMKDLYKIYTKGGADELFDVVEKSAPNSKFVEIIKDKIKQVEHGDISIRQSYTDFREWFDRVYDATKNEPETQAKLKKFGEEFRPQMEKFKEDPSRVEILSEELEKGVHLLKSINAPQIMKSMTGFAIDKASETFGNAAFNNYQKFGDSSPIIAIENPPAGMGLSRSGDLKKLVEESRDKFAKKLVEEKGFSESEAKKEAEKFIGATWDVGHINMIRKFGYGEAELIEETKVIAPFVKKVHLSDNFGFEHTELPMGMGNVPIKGELEVLKDKIGPEKNKAKMIVEAGNWYQHFQTTPFAETLRAFGSPIYGMQMQRYWNEIPTMGGGYFGGRGMNPDVHHSIYGSGFSTLPVELGGQMGGRSRLSGAPME